MDIRLQLQGKIDGLRNWTPAACHEKYYFRSRRALRGLELISTTSMDLQLYITGAGSTLALHSHPESASPSSVQTGLSEWGMFPLELP